MMLTKFIMDSSKQLLTKSTAIIPSLLNMRKTEIKRNVLVAYRHEGKLKTYILSNRKYFVLFAVIIQAIIADFV